MSKEGRGEFNPKHRLIGAIVLVAVGVILVPLILSNREPAGQEAAVGGETRTVIAEIAPSPQTEMPAAMLPEEPAVAVPEEPPAVAAAPIATPALTAPEPVPAGPVAASPAQPASVPPAPVQAVQKMPTVKSEPQTAPVKKASVSAPPSTKAKGWFVQVGTFSQADNARQLAEKLRKQGYTVDLERVQLAQGSATRVRVGPYAKDTLAKSAQTSIQNTLGIKGLVRQY